MTKVNALPKAVSLCLLACSLVQSPFATANGTNRGGTDGLHISEADKLQKIAQARALVKEVLINVDPKDVIFSDPELATIYTDANRFAVLADITRKFPGTDKYASQVVTKTPAEIFVIENNIRLEKLAVTEFETPADVLIREDFVASADVELIAQVLAHEFFHHLGIKDKMIDLNGEKKNQLDVLAVDIFAHYRQIKAADQQTIRERIKNLENKLKDVQTKLLGDNQVAGGKLTFTSPTAGEDSLGVTEDLLEAKHLRKFFVKSSGPLSWIGLSKDKLDRGQLLAKAKNFYCTAKGFTELRVFQKLVALSGEYYDDFSGHKSGILLSDIIEEYNRRIFDTCPKSVVAHCAPYESIGFEASSGPFGHQIKLLGPITSFGLKVDWHYSGIDDGDNHNYTYTLDENAMQEARICFAGFLKK